MKKTAIGPVALLAGVAIIVSGCTSSRIGALQTQPSPAPLNPAPSGQVTSGQLPPPVQPGAGQTNTNADGFPDAPQPLTPTVDETAENTDGSETQGSVQNVASAQPVTKEALVGAWQVSTAGSSCQMFMALTQWTGGFRAASRGCPGDAASVSAWNVSGQQVILSDSNGNKVATLFASGTNRFDGQTTSGRAITLSR